MARTTPELVGGIIKVRGDDDLAPFIETANLVVTDNCTASSYSAAKLELIERWLAAHFYAIHRPRRATEGVGGAVTQQSEPVRVDLGLRNTKYGQQAMSIDNAGNLARLENQLRAVKAGSAQTKWLGTVLG